MALRLHWPDERYVRIYCRDTLDWQSLSWDAQALYVHLCRKASRRGTIDLGRVGRKGVAALAGRPGMDLLGALGELEDDGCVRIEGTVLAISEFVEAQEAVSSGKARTQRWREGQRAAAEEKLDEPSGNESSPAVTPGYSTAGHGTGGTERPPTNRAALPARESAESHPGGGPNPRATAEEDHAAQVAALDAEASRGDKRLGRVLAALGSAWRTAYDTAQDLERKVDGVHSDLVALRRQGQVESADRGAPPVTHWRRTAGGSP